MLAGASDMSDSGTYSLLEDGCIGVSNGFPDLGICRIRAHDAVLALSSLL